MNIWTKISTIGHQADGTLQRYKSLLHPKRYLSYRRWLRKQNNLIPQDMPLVVFDFRDTRIDGPQGRRFYCLFIYFIRAGFYPVVKENYRVLGNIQEKHKRFCLQEDFSVLRNEHDLPHNYLLVTDKYQSPLAQHAYKIITINYDSDYQPSDACFPMPFPMFSPIYANGQDMQLLHYRTQPRLWKIFFGGDAESKKYNKQSISDIYKKLGRAQILTILSSTLEHKNYCELHNQEDLNTALQEVRIGLVVMNNRHCKVAPEQWLATMAKAYFFIACPGVRYPMSHNAIEALAVGSIPIIQYPEMFFPPLENGKNCLIFNNETELQVAINKAITMDEMARTEMSRSAIEYYETYLSPTSCIKRLLNHTPTHITARLLPFLKKGGGFA